MRKYRIIYGTAFVAILLSGLWGGGSLAPALLVVLGALPLLSAAGLFLSFRELSLSLGGEHSVSSGQPLKLTLTASRPGLGGEVRVRMEWENRVFGSSQSAEYLLAPGRGREQTYGISLEMASCGVRIIRIREMVCYDLLGIFSRTRRLEEDFTCVVYPYEASMYITQNRHREREQPGDIYDVRKSGTDVSEVFGLREYQEGDPLPSIHWKLSGKMRQLIVREFGRPVNYHTLLLLAPAFHYGTQEVSEKVVNAIYDLGISFSHALLNHNMAHFMGYLSGGELRCVPVDSLHSYEEMLLELMNHPVQKNGEETLLAFLNQQLYRQYTKVVYVTAVVQEEAARNLSVLADLTVLQAVEGPTGYLTGSGGYEVAGISIENIRKVEHMIPL